ncbi:MAG: hypothetical protein J6S86_04315 [Alphaproteobacteria bacterium]|nr:hypothetical protein [Alphaproteobacteria bacterium]
MKKHLAIFFSILSFSTVHAANLPERFSCFEISQKSGYQLRLDRIDREIVKNIQKIADECGKNQISDLLDYIREESVCKVSRTIDAFDFMRQKGIDTQIIESIKKQEQEEYEKLIDKLDNFFKNDPKWEFFKTNNSSPGDIKTWCWMESNQEYIYLDNLLKQNSETQKLFDEFKNQMKSITEKNIKKIKEDILKKHLVSDREWMLFDHEISDINNLEWESFLISSVKKIPEVSLGLRETIERYIAGGNSNQEKFKGLLNKYKQLNDAFLNAKMVEVGLMPDEKTEEQLIAEKILTNKIEKEIYESSRNPNEKEIEDLQDLRLIAEKHGVNEIRIIDAESLINALHLDEREKDRFQDLLKKGTQEEIENEIEDFIKNSKFNEEADPSNEEGYLREHVKNVLVRGAKKSKVHRDETIAFIAWSKANEPALYDVKTYPYIMDSEWQNRSTTFHAVKTGSRAFYKNIDLDLSENRLGNFYLYGLSENQPSHRLAYIEKRDSIFHEMGHVISGNMALATDVSLESYLNKQSSDIAMEIAGESIILKNENLLERSVRKGLQLLGNFADFCTGGRASDFIKEKFMEELGLNSQIVLPKERESKIKLFEKLGSSDALYTRVFLFHDPVELMQIMGISSSIHNGQNVLYLNKLSDCANSVLTGNYIQVDHDHYKKDWNFLLRFANSVVWPNLVYLIKGGVGINLDFYKALIKAYGSDPDDYFRRLEENRDK